jgi:hypothetical protein
MHTKATTTRAAEEVARWRCEQLVEAGFPLPLATTVANNAQYDLHALIELVERGCQTDLAVRILAPLEQENAA